MNYKPVPHKNFEKQAFAIPGILDGYNDLEEEFILIAELIKARKTIGKSQTEIAKQMHTSQSAIARLEGGFGQKYHSPTLDTLKRYAQALGCKLSIKLIPLHKHI
ncbi:MAG: helix-turn-helix transcriptional regulator [Gammaproteobacteria bacterium]|nr:helix-turn-helix transcriptional regulator [Gammaproteobacteria bacterium]